MSAASDQSANESWTVQRILEWTAGFLKQKGVESPRLEAELLLAHARKCPRIRLYTDFAVLLTDDERTNMRQMVQRRARREPLAYIVGTREFYGRPFEVTSGVLIPRPETEVLVDECLERIPRDEDREVVEVGFGSGCICITIAKQRPRCSIVATDLSEKAMDVAARNVLKHEVGDRIALLTGDTLTPLLSSGRRFDGLVSNPPYIRLDERDSLQPEVGNHEPPEALFAGVDGLDVVRRIAEQATAVLKPGAFIALELDPAQCDTVSQLLQDSGFENASIRNDLNGQKRVVVATLPAGI
jgi:release factor glutamine methyltransferase